MAAMKKINYTVFFRDGTVKQDTQMSWSAISTEKEVEYFGGKKRVIALAGLKKLIMRYEEIEAIVDVPEDCEVYQAYRSRMDFMNNGQMGGQVIGVCVGIVKNGEVIEERFLNGLEGRQYGIRK